MTPQWDHNNLLTMDPKDMEICDLPHKEFKIAILRKLNAVEENTERKFNKTRNSIYKQNEESNKETEIIKKKKSTK